MASAAVPTAAVRVVHKDTPKLTKSNCSILAAAAVSSIFNFEFGELAWFSPLGLDVDTSVPVALYLGLSTEKTRPYVAHIVALPRVHDRGTLLLAVEMGP